MGLVDCNLQSLQLLAEHAPYITSSIQVNITSGCWQWIGNINRNGYGRKSWRHPVIHRVVYNFFLGFHQKILPRGLVLDHKCRNRACCNPLHLEPVTVKENTLRGNAVLFTKGKQNDHSS